MTVQVRQSLMTVQVKQSLSLSRADSDDSVSWAVFDSVSLAVFEDSLWWQIIVGQLVWQSLKTVFGDRFLLGNYFGSLWWQCPWSSLRKQSLMTDFSWAVSLAVVDAIFLSKKPFAVAFRKTSGQHDCLEGYIIQNVVCNWLAYIYLKQEKWQQIEATGNHSSEWKMKNHTSKTDLERNGQKSEMRKLHNENEKSIPKWQTRKKPAKIWNARSAMKNQNHT